eukprot:c6298_g2_i1 orf=406-675(+)
MHGRYESITPVKPKSSGLSYHLQLYQKHAQEAKGQSHRCLKRSELGKGSDRQRCIQKEEVKQEKNGQGMSNPIGLFVLGFFLQSPQLGC